MGQARGGIQNTHATIALCACERSRCSILLAINPMSFAAATSNKRLLHMHGNSHIPARALFYFSGMTWHMVRCQGVESCFTANVAQACTHDLPESRDSNLHTLESLEHTMLVMCSCKIPLHSHIILQKREDEACCGSAGGGRRAARGGCGPKRCAFEP